MLLLAYQQAPVGALTGGRWRSWPQSSPPTWGSRAMPRRSRCHPARSACCLVPSALLQRLHFLWVEVVLAVQLYGEMHGSVEVLFVVM
eukprot:7501936-Pyramimonas_sp.AAC.1